MTAAAPTRVSTPRRLSADRSRRPAQGLGSGSGQSVGWNVAAVPPTLERLGSPIRVAKVAVPALIGMAYVRRSGPRPSGERDLFSRLPRALADHQESVGTPP